MSARASGAELGARSGAPARGLSPGPRGAGALVLAAGLPLASGVLVASGARTTPATCVLVVLVVVVAATIAGGAWVGVPGALLGALVIDWEFTPPYGSLAVSGDDRLVVLAVYLAVALAVSATVGSAARGAALARSARAEASALAALAGASLARDQTLTDLLERVRATFGVREVALVEGPGGPGAARRVVERVVAPSTAPAPSADDAADAGGTDLEVPASDGVALVLRGRELFAADRRVLAAFAGTAATALEGRRLAEQAREAARLAAAEEVRGALLAAVGHDLRTPLAGITAAASSLRSADVDFTPAERDELLEAIETSAQKLRALVANLLDASRLRSGALAVHAEPAALAEVIGTALSFLPRADRERVSVDAPDDLPDALVDPVLTERVLVNLLENSLRASGHEGLVQVVAAAAADGSDTLTCDVVDHGPGVPAQQWDTMFVPFQRLGDTGPEGTGLGLAVASGFAAAMGGSLSPRHTPGGGLTQRLLVPRAAPPHAGPPPEPDAGDVAAVPEPAR